MTLATEIIGDLRQRMASANQAMEDTMDRIARARAVVEVIWRAAEKDAVVSDALGGVMDLLEATGKKLGEQYDKDFCYLHSMDGDGKVGTTAG